VPGATASSGLIAAEAESLYALGDFDRVDYSLTGPASARVLEFRPVEKPWGPDFVQFDIGLASTGGNQIFAILRADHKRTWMNSRGGRWHNAVQLGRQTLVTTDFYQPLDTSQKFFLQPMLAYEQDIEDLYLNGDRLVDYTFHKWYGQLDAGVNLGTHAQARMGLRYGDTRATLRTGIPGLPETGWETDTRTHLQFIYDTRDVVALPTDGMFFNVRYLDSHDWLGGEQEYRIVEGLFAPAFNVRGNSLSLIIGGGTLLSGETPLSEQIELGGIRTFPGLRPGELRGTDYWFAGTSYLWRLTEVQPVFGQSIYGGIRLQAGEVRNDEATIVNETYYGISGSLAGRTPLGPFQLSLAYVFDEAVRFQFSIGRPVAEGSILDTLH
jgi:NTE family protein